MVAGGPLRDRLGGVARPGRLLIGGGRRRRRQQHCGGLGIPLEDGRRPGMGQPLELAPLVVNDLQHGGLGQQPLLAGALIDPGHGPSRRTDEQAVTDRSAQPGRQRDLARGLPGRRRRDLGGAVGLVLDPLPPRS